MIVLVGKQTIYAFWWLCVKGCTRIYYEALIPFKGNSLAGDPQNSKMRSEAVQSLSEGLYALGENYLPNTHGPRRAGELWGRQQQSGHARFLVPKKESETLRVCSRPLCKNFRANLVCGISTEVDSEQFMRGFGESQLELVKGKSAPPR